MMGEAGPDDMALWCALYRLLVGYWADVDYNAGLQAHEYYRPDALYAVGGNRFEGADKIRAFYARRRQFGNSTTRHLIDNFRVSAQTPDCAQAAGIMSLYRADGRPPFQGPRSPAMIADFEALCMRDDKLDWRFQSHLLRPIFVGADLPVSIVIDPDRL